MHRTGVHLLLLLGWVAIAGCDDRPTGERHDNACEEDLLALRVEVVTVDGARVKGATVTANNPSSNRTVTSLTDGEGVSTAITELVGPGTLRVWATAGARVSPTATVEWTCDDCHCYPEPTSVRLQLNR
ncbi:carboxypeptidase regulatory-like domain-containing protein [Myxococcaceae bacterium GXIMD 01537]